MLKLLLLGHPEIVLDGKEISLSSSKALALLGYLATSERAHSRTVLAGLLWGNSSETQARTSLRVALTHLRRAVGDYVVADRKSVGFDRSRDHWSDVAVLRAAHECFDAEAARVIVHQIRGEFLEDVQVRDAPEFELWLLDAREQMRRMAHDLMSTLVEHDFKARRYDRGLAVAHRLLTMDPWREEAHRWVIRFLALSGQRGAALTQYETCRKILAEELGVEPSPETEHLLEQVRAGAFVRKNGREVEEKVAFKEPPSNLPVLATSFVGRQRELEQTRDLLQREECRVLLLLGPGGIGKSRLAQEAPRVWVHDPDSPFPDGLFFVPLTDIEQESDLARAVAATLGLTLRAERTPLAQIQEHLAQKQLLMVLDNFEQLTAHAGFVADLLAAAPGLTVLITSRRRLSLLGAWHLELDGLDLPPDPAEVDPATLDLTSYTAVLLFWERARRLNLAFDLAAEATAVCRICRLVEGMPLALEMAASWTHGFACAAIAEQIATDVAILADSSPKLPARQRSLEAVFQYSWNALRQIERDLFAALAIFRGGFTLDAAKRVVAANPRSLLTLVERSLVRRLPSGRYDIHILLRRLAHRHLPPDRAAALDCEHARYFGDFLEERTGVEGAADAPAVFAAIEQELSNVHAAWHWAAEQSDEAFFDQAMEPLSRFYDTRGYFREGLARLEQAATAFPSNSLPRARLRARQARFAFRLGHNEQACHLANRALPVLEAHDATRDQAACLLVLGNARRDMGDHGAARAHFEQSADLFAQVKDHLGQAAAANNLGVIHFYEDDMHGAIRYFTTALEGCRRAGEVNTITELGNIGLCYGELGEYERAIAALEESLEQARQIGSQLGIGLAHHNLGNVLRYSGKVEHSLEHLQTGIQTLRALGSRDALAAALADLAESLIVLERFDEAHRALREGMQLEIELQRPRGIAFKHLGLGNLYLATEQDAHAREQFEKAISVEGGEVSPDFLQRALLGLSVVAARSGQTQRAARAIATIAAHPQATYETRKAARDWASRLSLPLEAAPEIQAATLDQLMGDVREGLVP